jgi:hypothetical protein
MALNALLNAFSRWVGVIKDASERKALHEWLDKSYHATAKIEDMISQMAKLTSPEVYLNLDMDVKLTRTELLEVSKSCYSGVLQTLVTPFTHLKVPMAHVQVWLFDSINIFSLSSLVSNLHQVNTLNKMACPWLECMLCTNCVIDPEPYHKKGKYLCPPCDNANIKVATSTNFDTTQKELNKENGISWLVSNLCLVHNEERYN